MKKLLIVFLALNLNHAFADAQQDLARLENELRIAKESYNRDCTGANREDSCLEKSKQIAEQESNIGKLKSETSQASNNASQEGAPKCDAEDSETMTSISKKVYELFKISNSTFTSRDRGASLSLSTLPGTTMFKTCQKVLKSSGTSIDQIYSGQNPSNLNNEQLNNIVDSFAGDLLSDAFDEVEPNDSQKTIREKLCKISKEKTLKNISGAYEEAIALTKNCLLFYSTAGENFDNEKKYKEDNYKKPDTAHKSWDGRISCKLSGPETIDFDECLNILNAYNGAKVVFEGTNAVQQLQAQDFMYEQQMKLMQTDTTDLDSATVGLESQKDGLKKQENMAETRRALLIAKIALLEGLVSKIPKSEDVINKCNGARFAGGNTVDVFNKSVTYVTNFLNEIKANGVVNFENASKDLCESSLFSPASSQDILANQGVATTVHAIAAEAGVDVVKESVAIDQFGKQQNMIDGVINKVKGAEVVDLPEGFTTQEELMKYCELNPTAGECVGFSGFSTQVGAGNGISMNGNFGTNSDDNLAIEDSSGVNSATGEGENLTKADIPTSTVIGGIDKGAGFADATPGKAKVENAGFASPTGGGGAGGASAPGLSGGASGGQAGPAGGNSPSSSKIAYSGGSRSLSFSGGRGNSKKSSSKDGNPFSEMFGKKTAANDVLNFRDLASKGEIGGKKGNIFEQISRQYNKVDKEDKLLKYDFVDKQ